MTREPQGAAPASQHVRHNLPHLRGLAGITQRALAKRLDEMGYSITHSAIAKIERGEQVPKLDDVVAFAAALDVSPLRLMLPGTRMDDGEGLAVAPGVPVAPQDAWLWAEQDQPWWFNDDTMGDPTPWRDRYSQWRMRRLGATDPDRPAHENVIDASGGTAAVIRELETLRSGDYGKVLAELREIRRDLGRALTRGRNDDGKR